MEVRQGYIDVVGGFGVELHSGGECPIEQAGFGVGCIPRGNHVEAREGESIARMEAQTRPGPLFGAKNGRVVATELGNDSGGIVGEEGIGGVKEIENQQSRRSGGKGEAIADRGSVK